MPFAHAAQLHERVARVVLVLGADDLVVIAVLDQAELDELRIGQEVQRDEIGARLLERRILLLQTACGLPFSRSSTLPEAWPMTSCMLVVSSPANAPHFSARATSSGVHENSLRNSGSVDLSYASLTFDSDTDLLP